MIQRRRNCRHTWRSSPRRRIGATGYGSSRWRRAITARKGLLATSRRCAARRNGCWQLDGCCRCKRLSRNFWARHGGKLDTASGRRGRRSTTCYFGTRRGLSRCICSSIRLRTKYSDLTRSWRGAAAISHGKTRNGRAESSAPYPTLSAEFSCFRAALHPSPTEAFFTPTNFFP